MPLWYQWRQAKEALTFEQALDVALQECTMSNASHAINYLKKAYALSRAYIRETNPPYFDGALDIQLQYCLSNMQHYRGSHAREVKLAFKAKIKELQTQQQ